MERLEADASPCRRDHAYPGARGQAARRRGAPTGAGPRKGRRPRNTVGQRSPRPAAATSHSGPPTSSTSTHRTPYTRRRERGVAVLPGQREERGGEDPDDQEAAEEQQVVRAGLPAQICITSFSLAATTSSIFFTPSSVAFCTFSRAFLASSCGDVAVLLRGLDELLGVAPLVAHRDLELLALVLHLLDDLLAPLLGERGDGDADDVLVGLGVQAQVGVADGLLDLTGMRFFSQGFTVMSRASATASVPTWASGVIWP